MVTTSSPLRSVKGYVPPQPDQVQVRLKASKNTIKTHFYETFIHFFLLQLLKCLPNQLLRHHQLRRAVPLHHPEQTPLPLHPALGRTNVPTTACMEPPR